MLETIDLSSIRKHNTVEHNTKGEGCYNTDVLIKPFNQGCETWNEGLIKTSVL